MSGAVPLELPMASQSEGRGFSQLQQQGRHAWAQFTNLLFPPRCGGCCAAGNLWCDACRASVKPVEPPWCEKCGEPNISTRLCSKCQAQPLQIEQIRSVALFLGPLRQGIHRFKYEKLSSLADPFGALLADYWHTAQLTADWLIPVPLHPSRERDRGYNQSNLLAQRLAAQVGIPVISKGLRRTRVTAVQMELNAAQRKDNVSGAFACADQRVQGARVIIIDDVCTTGATLEACAEALLKTGAASVMGLTLARTP
jgi:ComF family protein